MKIYRINDIFYSLQGEGHNTGRAAVFIRFAGCNLHCDFCDTEFNTYREMTADEIVTEVTSRLSPLTIPEQNSPTRSLSYHLPLIVLTGGEPTLQVDEAFVDWLHQHGFEVAMESNGTRPAPRNLDWLTVSPKNTRSTLLKAQKRQDDTDEMIGKLPNEIKIVFDENTNPEAYLSTLGSAQRDAFLRKNSLHSTLLYLQPCDTGDARRNAAITSTCVEYIKQHPWWRLSLQIHKLIGIE